MFFPSSYPIVFKSSRSASRPGGMWSPTWKTPIRYILPACCASAASDAASRPPASVPMNARRVITGSPLTLPSPLRGRGCSLRAVALHLAQLGAADLAADGLGQVADELDLARVLVGRGHRLDVLLELGGERVRRGVAGGEDHEGLDDLAAEGVGLADDGGLGDGGVLDQGGLHLEGADAIGRAVDHVVGAADEPEVAGLVHGGAVAGDVPVAAVALRRRLRVLPVLLEHADGPVRLHA